MGIAESLKYQKYKAGDFKGIPFWFTERLALKEISSAPTTPISNEYLR